MLVDVLTSLDVRVVVIVALCVAAGCSGSPSTRCEALCARVASCEAETAGEDVAALERECTRACALYERDREASAEVAERASCVDSAADCEAVLACTEPD